MVPVTRCVSRDNLMKKDFFNLALVLIVCDNLHHAQSYTVSDCKVFTYCQPYGSDWWNHRSKDCFSCSSGQRYHCARDYDLPNKFREACATEKFCPKGKEPYLSYIKDGKTVTQPEVFCKKCYDEDRYNDRQNTSTAEFSECPYKKWNKCTKEKHKILCKPDDSTSERYCRCDARKGFYPLNDLTYQVCNYKNYDCGRKECDTGEQLLLNYTCAPKCDEEFDRVDENTDDCKPIPSLDATTGSPSLPAPETANSSTTVFLPTKAPEPVCDEKCDEYEVCVSGKCVCPDHCTAVYDPVCGYHTESGSYKNFDSNCELHRSYCEDRKFVFHSNGRCNVITDSPPLATKWIILIVIGAFVLFMCLIYLFLKSALCKKYRDKCCRYRYLENRELIVEPPIEMETSFKSDVDGRQPNRRHINGRSVIIKETNIYHGTVIKQKGGEAQINIGSTSNKNVSYETEDMGGGENEPFLENAETEDMGAGENEPFLEKATSVENTTAVEIHEEKEQENIDQTAQLADDNDQNTIFQPIHQRVNENPGIVFDNVEADLIKRNLERQKEQSRKIAGRQHYEDFILCLSETNQTECCRKIETVEKEVLKTFTNTAADDVLQQEESFEDKANSGEMGTLEERAHEYLKELSEVAGEGFDKQTIYATFKDACNKIRKLLQVLTKKRLIPDNLPDCLETVEEYRNTPEGFVAYRSSGAEKSCLYQSISLLLRGTEECQYCLRLLATLHAVDSYKIYKEQLLNSDVEELKKFFLSHIENRTEEKIKDMNDAEAIIDVCLQTLIMETACLGTDSSGLHVRFLCGALGMNIHQHFQQSSYVAEKTVPWEQIIQDDMINPDLPDLHIFWVNHNKKDDDVMDHIVPLLPVKTTEHALAYPVIVSDLRWSNEGM